MAKIGILDSGVGALSILPKMFTTGHKVTCYIDDSNAPFGNKKHADLIGICSKNVNKLFELGMDAVVIMCNTLSSVCREVWHDKTSVIAVEPNLKALLNHKAKRKALICTPVTAECPAVVNFRKTHNFDVIPLESLAGIIDALVPDRQRLLEYVKKTLTRLNGYDVVVLGCTHYSLIKGVFKEAFPETEFVDGTEGVFARITDLYGTARGEKFELSIRTSSGGNLYKLYETVKNLKKF